jgi:hypothetical protein
MITGHSSKLRMSALLSSMLSRFYGDSGTEPCGCLKRHTITLHCIITFYNDMFDHMDGVMQDLAKKKTQWKKDLFLAVKCAQQKLSKY